MNKNTKRGPHSTLNLELVMQSYVIVCVFSTSGLDVLLMITLFLLGALSLRQLITAIRHQNVGPASPPKRLTAVLSSDF
jgi:hypothetical protein